MNRVTFTQTAKSDLRKIEQKQALVILKALARLNRTGLGDVKKLEDDRLERYRLRVGDWRVFFRYLPGNDLVVVGVENRKDAY